LSRPIQEVLSSLNNGSLFSDASDQLAALVLAVDSTGKSGKLTIEIGLRKLNGVTMAATGKVTLHKPAEPALETLLFPTPEGSLLRQDPRQMDLQLKPVVMPSAADLPTISKETL